MSSSQEERKQVTGELRTDLRRTASNLQIGAIRGRMDESDLVQEVFVDALTSLNAQNCESDIQSPLAWLRKILRNKLIDTRRFHLRGKRDVRREVCDSPEQRLDQIPSAEGLTDSAQEIIALIEKLDPKAKSVVMARLYGNMSYAEIGAQLGCSADAARKIWERALVSLRKMMTQNDCL